MKRGSLLEQDSAPWQMPLGQALSPILEGHKSDSMAYHIVSGSGEGVGNPPI